MASTDRELEQQLKEAGNKLLQHPSSVDGLVLLLDQVENFLSRVEQSPPKSMLDALAPSLKALVEDELLRHSDSDVKVGVASCISEITRITAPDAPYTDDKMKDVFQLIVSSFENLADKSSRSFNKRASILETVSKVRSCVVMLDLECDGLIVEMFQHFLKSIRDYHPENVFTSMEIIMTLVLEESEDISQELLNPLLASVKKSNEEVLPIARRLGERVFECCADKLKPYLVEAVNSSGVSLDEYSKIVASICEGTTGAVEHNDGNAFSEQLSDERKLIKESSDEAAQVDENKLTTASSDDTPEVVKESVMEEACPEEVVPVLNNSPRFVMSNGVTDAGTEEKSADPDSANQLLNVNLTNKGETDDSDAGKLVKLEIKPDQTSKRRGRKPNSSVNSTEHSDSSRVVSEKEAEKHPDRRKSRSKDVCSSPQSVEATVLSENEKEMTAIQPPSPKALESEAVNVASPPPSGSFPDESRPKKGRPKKKESSVHEVAPAVPPENEKSTVIKLSSPKALDSEAVNDENRPKKGRPKKKESLTPEVAPSVNDVSVKASDATSDSEVKKPQRHLGKKPDVGSAKGDKILAGAESSKNEDGATSDSEEKPLKQSGKKKVVTSDSELKPLKISVKKKAVQSDSEEKLLKVSGKKKVAASDSEEKLLKKSGKKVVGGDSEVKTPKQLGKKGDASDSEAKTPKQSGKKGVASDLEAKMAKQLGKKGVASDSEAKTPTHSVKKGGASKNIEDKPSLKKKENGKRRERGKDTTEKDLKISSPKDDEMVSSPKSAAKSSKVEDSIEETPKSDSKRKRTPVTGKDKVPEAAEYGEDLVGLNVKVWWPKDRAFYEGVVESFDSATKKHKVLYNDGDVEVLNLRKERWERIEGDPLSDGKQATEDPHLDSSSEMPKKKKAKTSSDKQEKTPVSPKRDGAAAAAAASSKSKGTTTKSSDKSKDHSKKKSGGKSVESKQDSPKTVSSGKSKGKSSGSGSKSNANKDRGAKVKESKEESAAKSPDTESESKTGKKRRRGAKA